MTAQICTTAAEHLAHIDPTDWWQIPFWVALAFKQADPSRHPGYDEFEEVAAALEPEWAGHGTFDIESVASEAWALWPTVKGKGHAVATAVARAVAEPAALPGPRVLRVIVAYAHDISKVHPAFVIPQEQIATTLGLKSHRTVGRIIERAVADGHIAVVDDSWSYKDHRGKLYRLGSGLTGGL